MNAFSEAAARDASQTSSRFRRFRVIGRRPESASIVSFELVPTDNAALMPFVAGQYVTVRLALPEGEKLLRTYSLSGDPSDGTRWRISVKREPAPLGRDDLPAGRGSSHLHEQVHVGDEHTQIGGARKAETGIADGGHQADLAQSGDGQEEFQ